MGYYLLVAGVILFVLGVITFFKTMSFTLTFYIYALLGLGLFVWGVSTLKKTRHEAIKDQTRARIDRMATDRGVPMKKCPACAGAIEAQARLCPLCGFRYPVVYTLTVFTPFEATKREGLIKYLMAKTKRTYQEISIQLERGLVFRYSSKEDSERSKASFENLGCKVKQGEIVENR
jgi:hypothetical protein